MSNKNNESQRKDKITWGQTLRLHLRAVKDIRRICPGAKVEKGLTIRGSSVKNAENDLKEWCGK